jgi:hypothetical protein
MFALLWIFVLYGTLRRFSAPSPADADPQLLIGKSSADGVRQRLTRLDFANSNL